MYLHAVLRQSDQLADSLTDGAGEPAGGAGTAGVDVVGSGRVLAPAALAAIARRFASAEPLWRPILRYEPANRWYERLALTDDVEVWLLSWLPGQRTRIHDHGGAAGAFAVVDGPIAEAVFRRSGRHQTETGTVRLPGRRTIHASGATASFDAGRIHRIGNGGLTPASSIHAYSPPGLPLRHYTPDLNAMARAGAR